MALWRPRCDRWAEDVEIRALEIDIAQFCAVDEALAFRVADDGVIFPTIPEPADDVYRFVKIPFERLAAVFRIAVKLPGGAPRRCCPVAFERLRKEASAAFRHVVKCGDGGRYMEGFKEVDRRARKDTGVAGPGSKPVCEQYGVEAIACGARKAVFEGDEIETFIKPLKKAIRLAVLPEHIMGTKAKVYA
ncbi:hypothetical protein AGR6A_Lc90276 [Agrobacterium sp. NCPPB 925]|nr:hypothetical protein AGR6A_Lc90276 [Agrobacterium sp. NCPPB 925]